MAEAHTQKASDELLKLMNRAIALYKQIIKKCRDEDDVVTRKLFEQIFEDEESHLDMFEGWLGDL
ncbi:MAG: ferritin-like domain-containing protein [bacterium]|nr:ferritin-like domain-containing protein [bacterium]MDT8367421.1 ferritin-like domain-containing protein [bacterium]